TGVTVREAARGKQFWLLIFVYAVCGFQDFFIATHIVAFAQDNGVAALFAGNMLAAMGLAGVVGVLLAGLWSDSKGPKQATLFCFVLRIALFTLILIDQSTITVTVFALVFGITFWLTAPLTVIFARDAFGTAHLGALSGLIVMVHHMCGGLGAYLGAVLFDTQGHYNTAFMVMLVLSIAAALLTLPLRR
ncbi:MAG: MFS transporter, partial [Rhizobiales bacterium]|nr:MFS transporter [Hyphomicrobiales bacterium]